MLRRRIGLATGAAAVPVRLRQFAPLLSLLATAGCATAAAASGESEPGATGPRLVAGVGTARYVAEEPAPDGRVFNREQGALRRLCLGLGHTLGDWSLQATLTQDDGTIDYAGQTQLAIPLSTSTDLSRRAWTLAAGHTWQVDEEGQEGEGGTTLTLSLGVQALRTERDIRATPISSRLTETLRTRQWQLGLGVSVPVTLAGAPLRLGATLQATRPWSHRLAVDTHGVVDALELRPGRRWGGQLGFDATLTLTPSVDVSAKLGWETYRPGASATQVAYRGSVPVGGASYPGSVQTLRHLGIVLGWRL
jgi:hypothetical protein